MRPVLERLFKYFARVFGVPIVRLLRQRGVSLLIRKIGHVLCLSPKPPRSAANTTYEWVRRQDQAGLYAEVSPAATLRKTPPRSIYPRIHWRFEEYLTQKAPPVFVATIPGGKVVGRNGAVVTADGTILGDLSREWFFEPEQHSLLFKPKLPAAQKLNGRIVTIAAPSGWNYYHWLLDVLPRFGILEEAGVDLKSIDYFVMNDGQSRFKTETLELLGIPEDRRLETCGSSHYDCDQLIAPSMVAVSGQAPKWAVDYLRRKFLAEAPSSKAPERIYLSRSRANYRKFTNEPEVRQLLLKNGFEEVFTEGMSFLDQTRLFASAKVIVAPHGAGLSNLVFCSPRTKVVEVFSPNYVNGCFWALANWAELDYFYVLGEGRRPRDYRDPHRVEQDIQADVRELEQTLQLAQID